jgi:hypothetical protein
MKTRDVDFLISQYRIFLAAEGSATDARSPQSSAHLFQCVITPDGAPPEVTRSDCLGNPLGFCLDLDKPDGDVMGESEDGESGDDGCLRQKPYVDINVIPVARLELNKKRITNNTKTAYAPL